MTFNGKFLLGNRRLNTCDGLEGSSGAVGAAVAATILVADAMEINDYSDLDIDQINEPERPILREAVTSIILYGNLEMFFV
ncbi:hypothetical protein GCM10009000_084290 [Halobacterium noricense]|uniref:Uncharacterized protein n=1 Tax=Haladaptatus pallidirubidus TaxID=1008152 RepID=A0AAV3UR31_9EURY